MSMSSKLLDAIEGRELSRKIYGVVTAVVSNTKDPQDIGRVKVMYPWLGKDAEGYWARVCVPIPWTTNTAQRQAGCGSPEGRRSGTSSMCQGLASSS